MPRFALPGAELDWELSDEGGAPVVQLHGLTSSRYRDRLLGVDLGLGLSGTRLLRYDARGHGRSTGRAVPEDYGWDALAHDLLALLDHVFPGEAVHGVGPSMGCGTLLHAIALDPGRFRGLTLVVPATAWETRAARAAEYRASADVVEQQGFETFAALGALAPRPPATIGSPITQPDVPKELLPTLFRGAALTDLPPRAVVARVAVPTTVMAWVDDPAHPVSSAEAIAGLVPGSRLVLARTPQDVAQWPAMLHEQVLETR